MKNLWTILCVLAIANLLALVGVVGWLRATDRLDAGRMREVRQLFSRSITEVRQEAEKKVEEAAAAEQQAKVDEKVGTAPVTASDRLSVKNEQSEIERQQFARLQKGIEDLRRSLLTEQAALDARIAEFNAQKKAWEAERAKVAAIDGEEQFQKALTTMEQLKPATARQTLQQLLDSRQVDQVVAYLNGMGDRTRTKVIEEFAKQDPKVAADLLERVRTRGVEPRGPEGSP